MGVIAYGLYLDFQERDEYTSLFDVGPHSRRVVETLKPWSRRLFLLWASALGIVAVWILIHALVGSLT